MSCDIIKEIDRVIYIASKLNELVDLLTCEGLFIEDLKELNTAIPTIDPIVNKFNKWINNTVVENPAIPTEKTATSEETPKRIRRNNIPETDLKKIGRIIRDCIPSEGLSLTIANRKMIKSKLAGFEQLFTTPSTLPRILRIERYPKVLSKYFRYKDGMLYRV
jgi:hypothetical protein